MNRRLIFALPLLLLSACAPKLGAHEIAPMPEISAQIGSNPALTKKVEIGSVLVVEGAGGPVAPLDAEGYRSGLLSALLLQGYHAPDSQAAYVLDANMTEVDYPAFGFNMDATATATYQLRNKATGEVLSNENVKTAYEAKFGESLDGTVRARLATAKAIRENITHYVRVLTALTPAQLKIKPESKKAVKR